MPKGDRDRWLPHGHLAVAEIGPPAGGLRDLKVGRWLASVRHRGGEVRIITRNCCEFGESIGAPIMAPRSPVRERRGASGARHQRRFRTSGSELQRPSRHCAAYASIAEDRPRCLWRGPGWIVIRVAAAFPPILREQDDIAVGHAIRFAAGAGGYRWWLIHPRPHLLCARLRAAVTPACRLSAKDTWNTLGENAPIVRVRSVVVARLLVEDA